MYDIYCYGSSESKHIHHVVVGANGVLASGGGPLVTEDVYIDFWSTLN